MIIEGTIKDDVTGNPIEGADIATYNPGANACTKIGVTDVSGRYLIDTPNSVPGLVVQKPGYRAVLVDMGSLQDNPTVGLQPFPALAGDAAAAASAVPAAGGILTKIPWWVWVAGGGALLMSGQKKAVGKAFDYKDLIVPGALLVGGYLIITKLGLGSNSNDSNNTAQSAAVVQANQAALQQATNAGVQPTLSQANAVALANDIFAQGTSGATASVSTTAQDKIMSDITGSINNVADWLMLKIAFGTRKAGASTLSPCSLLGWFCQEYDLDSFMKLALDSNYITDLHNFLQSKTGYNL
jgi:hypothetical protein